MVNQNKMLFYFLGNEIIPLMFLPTASAPYPLCPVGTVTFVEARTEQHAPIMLTQTLTTAVKQ